MHCVNELWGCCFPLTPVFMLSLACQLQAVASYLPSRQESGISLLISWECGILSVRLSDINLLTVNSRTATKSCSPASSEF